MDLRRVVRPLAILLTSIALYGCGNDPVDKGPNEEDPNNGMSTFCTADNCPAGVCVDDVCEPDADGDGIPDGTDNCPAAVNPDQTDSDGNGTGDACDGPPDADGDGVADAQDNCPDTANETQLDLDRDGIGDACDDDRDGDDVANAEDNCPDTPNSVQADSNGDGLGDVCDRDGDGVANDEDNCPDVANMDQADLDGNQVGDACDNDWDGDTVPNATDNCPRTSNADQIDTDADGAGDVCDDDDDDDSVPDSEDNCPLVSNPGQSDRNQNGIGDACDDSDGDGIPDAEDICPDEANPDQMLVDSDSDGLQDCDERKLGTDPDDPDTDGDGLDDLAELQMGTDPLVADSDQDGLSDGEEVRFGLDPTKDSTYNDGVLDGDRDFVQQCSSGTASATTTQTSTDGDWSLILPDDFTDYVDLTVATATAQNMQAAAVFEDGADTVAGFVLSYAKPTDFDPWTTMAQIAGSDHDTRMLATHDGFQAYLNRRFTASATTGKSIDAFRDDLLFAAAPFAAGDVSNLPTPAGAAVTDVRGIVSIVDRGTRVIIVAALADSAAYGTTARGMLEDAANTTGLSLASATTQNHCYGEAPVSSHGPVDIYWVLDQSGSMSDDYAALKGNLNNFFPLLTSAAIDFRMTVTSMDPDFDGKPVTMPEWFSTSADFVSAIDAVENGTFSGFEEFGLEVAKEGIEWMGSSAAPASAQFRTGAAVVTSFLSDEEENNFQNEPLTTSTLVQLLQDFETFFAMNSPAFSLVTSGMDRYDDAESYRRVSEASGGAHYELSTGQVAFVEGFAEAAAAHGTHYQLSDVPVSGSMRVYVGATEILADPVDGWVYFAETNSVVFNGASQPTLADPSNNVTGDGVTVIYDTYVP